MVIPKSIREWTSGSSAKFFGGAPTFILWLVRFFFIIMSIGIATTLLLYVELRSSGPIPGAVSFLGIMAICGGVIAGDILTRNKQITTISAVFFGLLMGFILSALLWQSLEPIINDYLGDVGRIKRIFPLFTTLITCYLAVSLLLQTKDDFRFLIPYVEFSKQLKGAKPLVLDTSVIIDGRIADICDTGIIDTKLVVPRFVLQELQGIADSSDKIKRNRGRRGLDILKRMQGNPKIEVQLHEANLVEMREVLKVDERLVVLAKHLGGRVVTNDFNLNKICQVQNVEVINLNELSNALKLVALPGELLSLKIVKQGDQFAQGVGYLDDGTMVVVEQGRNAIGQEVPVMVTSVLQTPAGRMVFGRIENRAAAATAP
ncbi:MAG: PIN domain-containing protein [Planctomycetota bacterium]|jgi:uncharacterized protein YacL